MAELKLTHVAVLMLPAYRVIDALMAYFMIEKELSMVLLCAYSPTLCA